MNLDRECWAGGLNKGRYGVSKSDKQREVARLIKGAFSGREIVLSQEVPCYFYSIDMILDFRRPIVSENVAIEISNNVTKSFRTAFASPRQRVRSSVIASSPHQFKQI